MTLEEKILKAKNLGVTFQSSNGLGIKPTDPRIITCMPDWTDHDFEKELDKIIVKLESNSSFWNLLSKHKLLN